MTPTEGVVSCSRVVVGAVGAFCGAPTFEGFAHRFDQECAGDGVSCRESVRAECSHAVRCPVACGKDAQLIIGGASRRGGVRAGGIGLCCDESASDASESHGGDCFSQGRGCGNCRHCLSCQSTTSQLLYKRGVWRWNYTPVTGTISGASPAPQTVHGATCRRNERSDILPLCLPVVGALFNHWRSDMTFPLVTGGATRRAVRKHRAPKGALRHVVCVLVVHVLTRSESTERQKVH